MNAKKRLNNRESIRNRVFPITIFSTFLSLILSLGKLLPIILLPKIIDEYIPIGNMTGVLKSLVIMIGVPLVLVILNTLYQYYLITKTRTYSLEVAKEVISKIIHQPMSFFDKENTGELVNKCSNDVNSLIMLWTMDYPQLISSAISIVYILYLLAKANILLFLLNIFYLPFLIVLMMIVGKKVKYYINIIIKANSKYYGKIQEIFRSAKFIKAQQLEEFSVKEVEECQKNILRYWGKTVATENLTGGITINFLPSLFYGLNIVLSAILIIKGNLTIGLLTAVVGYASQLHNYFNQIYQADVFRNKAEAQADVVFGFLNLPDEYEDGDISEDSFNFEHSISFNNLSFSYVEDKNVLDNISINFSKGKWISIAGSSGAGKSTILELILRFYHPQNGDIAVDNRTYKEIRTKDIRKNIFYVPQNPYLMTGTLFDNIKLINSAVSESEVFELARKIDLVQSIDDLHREVGESGQLLSGGEKQRVAILQSYFSKKPVILLDEVTSALDMDMEKKVIELYRSLCEKENRTIISVAHRESFRDAADFIYTLDSNN